MNKWVVFSLVLGTFAVSAAQAGELKCTKVKQPKKKDSCFTEKSNKLTVEISGKKITVNSDELKDVEGTFEKKVASTGDSQYAAEGVAELQDQSDLGKVFVSEDQSKVTLSLRFTDDDGPQSFEHCEYKCD